MIEIYGILISGDDWAQATVFDGYLIPALQKELDLNPFGICGFLIPPPGSTLQTNNSTFSEKPEVQDEANTHMATF